jgi:hypothetical protein
MLKPSQRAHHAHERFYSHDGCTQEMHSAEQARPHPTPIKPGAKPYQQEAADYKRGVTDVQEKYRIG